jgi:hypothetical protein
MGKVWPPDSVAFNEATTRISTITALDESPLLEGLIYVGTDDGLVQVTEDGGKTWRKADPVQGVPEFTYVTDVQPSSRDVNTVFATFNDWNRGNFKPYVYKSADRGRTWTSISGDLPQRSGAWSIVQDAVNPSLLFIGIEYGLYATVDGGQHWVKMAGVPTSQVRDVAIQKREGDLVAGTFGRGVYILDDYTALREMTPQALADKARLYPLRDAYQFNELRQCPPPPPHPGAPSPVRRAPYLQHRAGGERSEVRLDHLGQRRQADPPPRSLRWRRDDARAAPDRVRPASGYAGRPIALHGRPRRRGLRRRRLRPRWWWAAGRTRPLHGGDRHRQRRHRHPDRSCRVVFGHRFAEVTACVTA